MTISVAVGPHMEVLDPSTLASPSLSPFPSASHSPPPSPSLLPFPFPSHVQSQQTHPRPHHRPSGTDNGARTGRTCGGIYRLHSALHTVHAAVRVLCTLHSLHSAHATLYSAHTLRSARRYPLGRFRRALRRDLCPGSEAPVRGTAVCSGRTAAGLCGGLGVGGCPAGGREGTVPWALGGPRGRLALPIGHRTLCTSHMALCTEGARLEE